MKTVNPNKGSSLETPIHPIFSPVDFYIDTPMIGKLEETLTRWIWTGQTGGYVLGGARMGKTRAAELLKLNLKSRTNEHVPAHHVTISNRDVKTVASVFRRLALSLGEELKKKDTADDISARIIVKLADQAQGNQTRQIVLLVDEFQRLTIQQFAAFSELYDQLREIRINLVTVFIGNKNESSQLLEQIYLTEHEHICGRFFINNFEFGGISNVGDVKYCLKQYDSMRQIPGNTDSTTQYFLREEFNSGFRLAALAETVWSIFNQDYRKKLHLKYWGTQYFLVAINTLLLDYLPRYGVSDRAKVEEMIMKSIDTSGLLSGLIGVCND